MARYNVHNDPNFPGLTEPGRDFALHHDQDLVYGCMRPESPDIEAFDWRCPQCVLAAKVVVLQFGDDTVTWSHAPDAGPREVSLSWLIARSEYWGVLEDLVP